MDGVHFLLLILNPFDEGEKKRISVFPTGAEENIGNRPIGISPINNKYR